MEEKDKEVEEIETEKQELQQTTQEQADTTEEDAVQQEQQEQTQQDIITKLEAQCADYLDKYQRCFAEFDNFRKRTIKEKASMYDDGVRSTVEKLLPVIDNLERAVAVECENNAEDSFYKGVAMTLKQFQEILTTMGVEPIKALGETFNPNLHAAVAHEDNEEYGENIIMLEMQKGYKYKDKVIRHSMVKVAN
ncbi:nucleotide exchange factor GrpE [Clostridium sp. MD294]|uniref:nucleotide exchange factor GrpE n=1 Tax=Clostridium sp. MD294 TaxID=97138 RepID=UPI0002CB7884|nr:nucleotide exchange factor GrpE [Clostridium sp. MD294]NDO46510.1 nucleotide exchange factor GrpE [Clostridium sp. MD294]USF29061.1 Protein GrpE [Clostridium sp. MD294]